MSHCGHVLTPSGVQCQFLWTVKMNQIAHAEQNNSGGGVGLKYIPGVRVRTSSQGQICGQGMGSG